MSEKIDSLGLDESTVEILLSEGIETVEDLQTLSGDLVSIKGIGKAKAKEITDALSALESLVSLDDQPEPEQPVVPDAVVDDAADDGVPRRLWDVTLHGGPVKLPTVRILAVDEAEAIGIYVSKHRVASASRYRRRVTLAGNDGNGS